VKPKGRAFVTIPYTFHMNDIRPFPFQGRNPAAYEQALKDEFYFEKYKPDRRSDSRFLLIWQSAAIGRLIGLEEHRPMPCLMF
jgi:hypothetical protein